jgi:uncharacterized protein with von Willebrand factor type A (vWA) domain
MDGFRKAMIGTLLLLAPLVSMTSVASSSIGKVMLVLDASGSMWGMVEGQEKLLVARE